jgi:hypothetical protein
MPEIKAIRGGDRKLRYFPADYNLSQQPTPEKEVAVTVILPSHIAKNVEILIKVGKFNNPNDALIWLASEGVQAKQNELTNIERIVHQIDNLKRSVSI